MRCPRCQSKTRVTHTDANHEGEVIRRRVCTCGHRFHTTERSDEAQLGIDAQVRRVLREAAEAMDEIDRYSTKTPSRR